MYCSNVPLLIVSACIQRIPLGWVKISEQISVKFREYLFEPFFDILHEIFFWERVVVMCSRRLLYRLLSIRFWKVLRNVWIWHILTMFFAALQSWKRSSEKKWSEGERDVKCGIFWHLWPKSLPCRCHCVHKLMWSSSGKVYGWCIFLLEPPQDSSRKCNIIRTKLVRSNWFFRLSHVFSTLVKWPWVDDQGWLNNVVPKPKTYAIRQATETTMPKRCVHI